VEVGSSFVGGSGIRDRAVVAVEIARFMMRLVLLIRRSPSGDESRGDPAGGTGTWRRVGAELGMAAEDVLAAGRVLLQGERRDGRDTTIADSQAARLAQGGVFSGGSMSPSSWASGRGLHPGGATGGGGRPRLIRRFLVAGGEADTAVPRQAAERAILSAREADIPLAFSWAGEAGDSVEAGNAEEEEVSMGSGRGSSQ